MYILELKYLKYKINPFPPKILQHLLAHFTESANVQCLCIYLLYIPYIKHLTVVIYIYHHIKQMLSRHLIFDKFSPLSVYSSYIQINLQFIRNSAFYFIFLKREHVYIIDRLFILYCTCSYIHLKHLQHRIIIFDSINFTYYKYKQQHTCTMYDSQSCVCAGRRIYFIFNTICKYFIITLYNIFQPDIFETPQ